MRIFSEEPACRVEPQHHYTELGTEDDGDKVDRCNHCLLLRYTRPEGIIRYEDHYLEGGDMSCTSCGENPTTVGEVKQCSRCKKAGVADQLAGIEDGVLVSAAIVQVPGLANRFVNMPKAPEPAANQAQQAQPKADSKPAAKRAAKRAPAKKAPAKKKRR